MQPQTKAPDPFLVFWKGANDWVNKDGWYRCSKESSQAPLFDAVGSKEGPKLSAGFAVTDTAGIIGAIPFCIKEAIDNVKK